MAKEKVIDNLCALAINRYRTENPTVKITDRLRNSIRLAVSGEYERNGETAAYKYVKTAELLEMQGGPHE